MTIRALASNTQPHVQMTFADPAHEELKAKVEKIVQNIIHELKSKIPLQHKDIEQFTCSITLEVYKEPVMDEHGHTFEKMAIQKHLRTSPKCPINREPINTLIPNRVVQQAIEKWQKQEPIPTFSLFKKSIPGLAQKNLAMVQAYIEAKEYEEAISCYGKALQYTQDWKDYQNLPPLFEKNQQKDHAILSYLYLLQYQRRDQKIPLALDTLLQCINTCPCDYPFYNSLYDLYSMISEPDNIFHSNLQNGIYASHLLEGHSSVITRLVIDNGRLYSCSFDNTIKVWDLNMEPPTCTATLEGHKDFVISLAIANGNLYSGSRDKTVKIWDLKTTPPTCTATLTGHTDFVISLAVANGNLYASSSDKTLKIWDLNTNPPDSISYIRGFARNCETLIFAHEKLFSCSFHSDVIMILDLNTTPFCCNNFVIGEQYGQVKSLIYAHGKLFTGFKNGTIVIWDPTTYPPTHIATFQEHTRSVESLVVANGMLFSFSADFSIKIWDLNTNPPTCTATLETNMYGTWAPFAFANKKLFLSIGSREIKILDFTAKHDKVFKEIASQFNKETPHDTESATARLSRMPEPARKKIIEQHYKMLKSQLPENGQGIVNLLTSNEGIKQAILNYLEEQRREATES